MGVENIIKFLRKVYCLLGRFSIFGQPKPTQPTQERFIVFSFWEVSWNLKIRFLGENT
jgi:hypothetical protein